MFVESFSFLFLLLSVCIGRVITWNENSGTPCVAVWRVVLCGASPRTRLHFLALLLALLPFHGRSEPLSDPYARVDVAPTRTSIYLGSVSMTMPSFVRVNGGYEAPYTAKVFPFFFYNETGRLRVEMPDEALRQLERGERIEFTGLAVTDEGAERRVEGTATPTDSASGKLKVRVFYSKRIQLIFNTTYRFAWKT